MERLTMTSDKGGLAFTFDLDINCKLGEMRKIAALGEHLKAYEDLNLTPFEITSALAELGRLKRFKQYWSELYGTNLEIANWHLNGALEPFDNFYDSAEEYEAKLGGAE